jgi:hypothetical protein
MTTSYKASPFALPGIQSYIVKGVEVDEDGAVNSTGTSGSVYTMHISSSAAGADYVLIWDDMTMVNGDADIVIPITASEDLVVYIDKGITCLTAITFAASRVPYGGTAPNSNVNVNLFIN